MAGAPIRILGWDAENRYWAAVREGEPSFVGVQDLGDAVSAATSRDVDIVVADGVYDEMVANKDAWLPRPSRVRSSS